MDTGLDKNETELRVKILLVLGKVVADGQSLLDEVVEVLRDLGSQAVSLEDAENLGASDSLDVRNTAGVSEDNTDLRGEKTLASELEDLVLDGVSLSLGPIRCGVAVRAGRAGDTLAIHVE